MEIKYKGNFQAQGHPKIPDKRDGNSNRRLSIK